MLKQTMAQRGIVGLILMLGCFLWAGSVAGQDAVSTPIPVQLATPIPAPTADLIGTLPVPTRVAPVVAVEATARPEVSAVQRIRDTGVLRVGVYFNNAPMSSLGERGLVVGYEADLARAVAEDWGVTAEFVQVTGQNAVEHLLSGDVDILMGAIPHRREFESLVSFSQSHFPSGQYFLIRKDSDLQSIAQLSGRSVGIVQGTSSERTLGRLLSNGVLQVNPVLVLTLDQGVGALGSGAVDALLVDGVQLVNVRAQNDTLEFLPDPLEPEPYALAYRKYDQQLGYMLDRSLQRIFAADGLDDLRRTWLSGVTFQLDMPVWAGLDEDQRGLADFDTAMVYPAASVLDTIKNGQSLRVSGLALDPQLTGLNQRIEAFYQALVYEMTGRWGVTVELIPNSADNALDLVRSGEAALAIGIAPSWTGPYEVAYSAPLIQHGDRMMVPFDSSIEGYADLRGGRWVGIFASEPGAADAVNEWAESVNSAVHIYTIINDEDAVYSMLVDQNIDVVFGDGLRLQPMVEANPESVRLTDRWYTTEYTSIATRREDADFLALVNITLQEIGADGTFAQLWTTYMGAGEPVTFEQWPGDSGTFVGINIGKVQ